MWDGAGTPGRREAAGGGGESGPQCGGPWEGWQRRRREPARGAPLCSHPLNKQKRWQIKHLTSEPNPTNKLKKQLWQQHLVLDFAVEWSIGELAHLGFISVSYLYTEDKSISITPKHKMCV